jgi:hypothetical protein
MEIRLSALRGAAVSMPDAPPARLRDVYLDSLYWIVRDLVLDMPGMERPRVVPVILVHERQVDPPSLTLRAATCAPSHGWDADRRSAVGLLGYGVEGCDGPIGRVADLIVDDARWNVRAVSVRAHAPSGGTLTVPVLAVAALMANQRRMVLRLDRAKLMRFRHPRAVEARA